MRRPRQNHSPRFKPKVATVAIWGDKTLAELADHYDVHAYQIQGWKKLLLKKSGQVFGAKHAREGIREAPVQCDWRTHDGAGFFIQSTRSRPVSERKAMIAHSLRLSVARGCRLLAVARVTVYLQGNQESKTNLEVMRLLNAGHLKYPFYGSHRLRNWLETRGHAVNRKSVQCLVRLIGLSTMYPRKKTSHPSIAHRIYTYALRNVRIP